MQFFIVLSCLISVSVNFSTFLVIGKTSPVTYQVLGHLKTCLVLTFGYVLLHDPFSWRNILGILIAVVGMVLYSYFCTVETQQKNAEVSPQQVPFLCAGEISVCAFNFCCPSELDTLPHLSISGKSWKAHKFISKYWISLFGGTGFSLSFSLHL